MPSPTSAGSEKDGAIQVSVRERGDRRSAARSPPASASGTASRDDDQRRRGRMQQPRQQEHARTAAAPAPAPSCAACERAEREMQQQPGQHAARDRGRQTRDRAARAPAPRRPAPSAAPANRNAPTASPIADPGRRRGDQHRARQRPRGDDRHPVAQAEERAGHRHAEAERRDPGGGLRRRGAQMAVASTMIASVPPNPPPRPRRRTRSPKSATPAPSVGHSACIVTRPRLTVTPRAGASQPHAFGLLPISSKA